MPAPKGHPPFEGGGRPKKYTDEFIEKEADAFEEWMKDPKSLWYEDFASSRGYSPKLLSIWGKENAKFSEVYEKSQFWQKSLLLRGGLLSKFNPSITKLVLANTCGWTDKQESKISGSEQNPLSFIINNISGKSKDLINE